MQLTKDVEDGGPSAIEAILAEESGERKGEDGTKMGACTERVAGEADSLCQFQNYRNSLKKQKSLYIVLTPSIKPSI